MFNVCPGCGQYSVEKQIDPDGPAAICPFCGHRHPFRRLPLFVVTGASGAGKTTVALALPEQLPECVTLETDILWRPEFNKPDDDYHEFRETWLRLAKNVSQNGRPVVLCGTAAPGQFERCAEARYFSAIHCLALVCDDDVLVRRLRARPAWRQAGDEAFVERMLSFNAWLKARADAGEVPAFQMSLLDTTCVDPSETVERVVGWVRACASERNSLP
ncbi:MAG TPA: AAA family ATPase [Chloroflexota bacterium]|nr:AAA family ATPase [Chloroflexota bacterium]